MPTPDLPHLSAATPFVTDGGLETTLLFHEGVELPLFAAFVLLDDPDGRRLVADYYAPYLDVAREHATGFVGETPTWRANPDWGARLGYDAAGLDRINRGAVEMLRLLGDGPGAPVPFLVSGCLGPRGDGYVAGEAMDPGEAADYHAPQIASLTAAGADMIAALTMTHPEEAIGVLRAAGREAIPAVISFTVETDGRLPNGQPLREAIERVDDATSGAALYFMVNCAHPEHFASGLGEGDWLRRIRGLRANASRLSHAELDEAAELDEGDPHDLGRHHGELRRRLPWLAVLGGCCGTDHRHVREIMRAWVAAA